MRQTLAQSKSFDGMSVVVGSWNGKEDFDEIVRSIETNPPRQHRLPPPPTPHNQQETAETLETTPPGTQNPEPPSSGAPLLPNTYRSVLPPMATGHDASTPTPGGSVSVAAQ